MNSVLLPKNINLDKIKYSELKKLPSGAKQVYLNYAGSKINVQTPVMNIPYGVNDNMQYIKSDAPKDEEKKYDITVSFKGIDENPKIKSFHDKMKELEEKIIDDAFKNSLIWFKGNKIISKDVVANMFTPIIKRDKDKTTGDYADKYPPTFKAKLPYNTAEDKFGFDSYDMDNNEIDFNEYVSNLKGGRAQFIIQLNGIWFSAGMFGCSWRVVSGKFQQLNTAKLAFVLDSEDDVEEEDEEDIEIDYDVNVSKVQQPIVTVSNDTEKSLTIEEDEDEDDESESHKSPEETDTVVEEEPVKKKPAVKKAVKKP